MAGLHLHFDPYSGVSGDMTLGALADLGVPVADLAEGLGSLPIGPFALRPEPVMRQGIRGTQMHVEVEEDPHAHRHLHHIYDLIDRANLPARVLARAKRAYYRLAAAEAHVHGTTVEAIHFHEVGAKDAIIDVAGAMLGMELLGVDTVSTGTVITGYGTVRCAHGLMPVPAPATAQLLLGLPQAPGEVEGEMVTPTGAAILATLLEESTLGHVGVNPPLRTHEHQHEHAHSHEDAHHDEHHQHGHEHGHHHHDHDHGHDHGHSHAHDLPATPLVAPQFANRAPGDLTVVRVGYGAGTKIIPGRPNFLRLNLCQAPVATATPASVERHTVLVLETEIDDMNPETAGYVMDLLFGLGAYDVQFQPVQMKKNRPGLRLRVIAEPDRETPLIEAVFRETSTFGVRRQLTERWCLQRRIEHVHTEYGVVHVKLGYWGDAVLKAAPEFEDCRKLAQARGVALNSIYEAARQAALRLSAV